MSGETGGNMQVKTGAALFVCVAVAGLIEFVATDQFANDGLVLPAVLTLVGIGLMFLGIVGAFAFVILCYAEWGLEQEPAIGVGHLFGGSALASLGAGIIALVAWGLWFFLQWAWMAAFSVGAVGGLILMGFVLAFGVMFGGVGLMCVVDGFRVLVGRQQATS